MKDVGVMVSGKVEEVTDFWGDMGTSAQAPCSPFSSSFPLLSGNKEQQWKALLMCLLLVFIPRN